MILNNKITKIHLNLIELIWSILDSFFAVFTII